MQAILIQFRFPRKKGISMSTACKAYRKLYGYNNISYYGRYRTRVSGLLDEIPSIRYPGSTIMVRKDYAERIIKLLKDTGAEVYKWTVIPTLEESRKLKVE